MKALPTRIASGLAVVGLWMGSHLAHAVCAEQNGDGTLESGDRIVCTDTDEDGVIAAALNDITLTIDVSATVKTGIHLHDRVVITNHGAIRETSGRGIDLNDSGVVTNHGTITETAGRGVSLRHDGTVTNHGTVLVVGNVQDGIHGEERTTILNSGLISTDGADSDAIDVNDDSTVTITATGSVIALGRSAGAVLAGQRSTIENHGMIAARGTTDGDTTDSHGVNFDETGGSLVNSGVISSTHGFGVFIDDDNTGAVTTITNDGGGHIAGGQGSIASDGATRATIEHVVNRGTLTGDVSLGAGNDTVTLSGAWVVNGAIDLGSDDDTLSLLLTESGDARLAEAVAKATNYETLEVVAEGAGVTASISAGSISGTVRLSGDGRIVNAADVSAAGADALALDDGASLVNNGALSTTGGQAEGIFGEDDLDIVHHGAIHTTGDSAQGIQVRDMSEVMIGAEGVISTTGDDAEGVRADDDSVVVHNGSIETSGEDAEGIIADDNSVVVHNGSIETSGADADGIDVDDDSTVTITATGSVIALGRSAGAILAGQGSTVENHGMIAARGTTDGGATDSHGVNFDETGGSLVNSGVISSTHGFGVFIDDDNTGAVTTITNDGGGHIAGGQGSIASDGATRATIEHVVNRGTLTGDVSLGAGDDTVTLSGAWVVDGAIDLGSDDDTLSLLLTESGDARLAEAVAKATNYETLEVVAEGAGVTASISAGSVAGTVRLSGDGRIVNAADVSAAGADALALDDGASLVNNGALSTTGGQAEGIFGEDDLDIVHHGAVHTTGDSAQGIQVNDASSVTIGAAGGISTTGDDSEGVRVRRDNIVVHQGLISTIGEDAAGIWTSHRSSITVGAGAAINTSGTSAEGVFGLDEVVVAHRGAIDTEGGDAEGIEVDDMSEIMIGAEGVISTTGDGAEGVLADDDSVVVHNGSIETSGADADGIDVDDGSRVVLSALARIAVSGTGAEGVVLGEGSTLTNAGSITANGATSGTTMAIGARFDEGVGALINAGVIDAGFGVGVSAIFGAGADVVAIENQVGGVIAGDAFAIDGSNGAERIRNAGAIVGDVRLELGDDEFVLLPGGTVSGNLRLDGGDDSLSFLGDASPQTVAGAVSGGTGTDTLSFAGTASVLSEAFSGFEIFRHVTGTTTVVSDHDFVAVTVHSGEMALESEITLGGDVTLASGAALSGYGAISGTLTVDGGTLAPGADGLPGEMAVDGDLAINAGSRILVRSARPGTVLTATGAASIDEGVVVQLTGGPVAETGEIVVIQADGGIAQTTGALTVETVDLLFADVGEASVGDGRVSVFVRNFLDGSTVPLGRNAALAGQFLMTELRNGLDAHPGAALELRAVSRAAGAERETLERALSGLGPEPYATAPVALMFEQFDSLAGLFRQRAEAGVRRGEGERSAWGGSWANSVEYDAEDALSGYDVSQYAMALGGDFRIGDILSVGALATFAEADADFSGLSASLDARSTGAGAYAIVDVGNWHGTAMMAFTRASVDASRSIANGLAEGGARSARSDFDMDGFALHGQLSYDWALAGADAVIRPHVAVDFYEIGRDAAVERGATTLGLAVEEQDTRFTVVRLGAHLAKAWPVSERLVLRPELDLEWYAKLGGTDAQARARMIEGRGSVLLADGVDLPDGLLRGVAGVTLSSGAWRVAARYHLDRGSGYAGDKVSAYFELRF